MKARTKQLLMALAIAMTLTGVSVQAAETLDNWWVHVRNDRSQAVRIMLAKGANPNVLFENGQPAIMRAVMDNAWRVFDVLAAHPRTDLNAENPAGETPLMYLAVAGETERARALISRGAKVNRLGWTPLHYAASRGRLETTRLLLDAGAMPNAPAPEGRTPLMMAAYSGNPEVVQLLLDRGADPVARDTQGKDAADWALEGKWIALSDELRRVIHSVLRQRAALRGN